MAKIDIENGVLKRYHYAKGDITLPEGVIEIGACAFDDSGAARGLREKLSTAFDGIAGLPKTNAGNSFIRGGLPLNSADFVLSVNSLTSVTLPHGVIRICERAFSNCRECTPQAR